MKSWIQLDLEVMTWLPFKSALAILNVGIQIRGVGFNEG